MAYEKRDLAASSGHPAVHLNWEGQAAYLDVSGGVDPHYIDCTLPLDDIDTEYSDFLVSIASQIRTEPTAFGADTPDPDQAAACAPENVARLQEIARLGRKLFNALVPPEHQARLIAALHPVTREITMPMRPVIELSPVAARLPWSLFYISDELPQRADDVRGFLGCQFLFLGRKPRRPGETTRAPGGHEEKTDLEKALAQVDQSPKVGHIWDDQFLLGPRNEHWYHRSSIPRDELQPFTAAVPDATRTEQITSFVLTPRDRLHFDAHGVLDAGDRRRLGAFGLQKRMTEPRSSARAWAFVGTNGNLLITMNVCHAASSRIHGGDGFAPELRGNGAAAVIAPWTVVAYPLAMRLMQAFHEAVGLGQDYLRAFDQAQVSTMRSDVAALSYLCIGDLNFLSGGLTPEAVVSLFSQDAT